MAVAHPSMREATKAPPLTATDRCPWCEQPIAHTKFLAITARIAREEKARAATAQRRFRAELDKQKVDIETRAASRIAEIEASNTAAIAAAERDAKSREAAARIAERKASKTRIALAEAARRTSARQLADFQAHQEKLLTKQRQVERAAYEKALKTALDEERERSFQEKERLSNKVETLQREVSEQRAATSGEGAGLDIAEELKGAFPSDRIRALGNGAQGANLIHEVVDHGRECGVIVYDIHKRRAWRDSYVSRIRKDQLAAKADQAIIATQVLPAQGRQVHIEASVLVANPARVLVLVELIRRHLVQMSTLRLSLEARADKSAHLYDFISSDRFQQLLDEIDRGNDSLLQLDVEEQRVHASTWQKRGQLVKAMQKAHGLIESTIDDILGLTGDEA